MDEGSGLHKCKKNIPQDTPKARKAAVIEEREQTPRKIRESSILTLHDERDDNLNEVDNMQFVNDNVNHKIVHPKYFWTCLMFLKRNGILNSLNMLRTLRLVFGRTKYFFFFSKVLS